MNGRDLPRWVDSEAGLPEELRLWLRGGGAGLGSASEVAELRQRLVAVLGAEAGLGSGEPSSGESSGGASSGDGGAPGESPNAAGPARAAAEPATPAPAERATTPVPQGAAPQPPAAVAPPVAPLAALGQGLKRHVWVALSGAGLVIGLWVYGGRSPAPGATSSVPVPTVSTPAPSPVVAQPQPEPSPEPFEAAEPPPRQPTSAGPGRPSHETTSTQQRRAARSKPSRPPSLGEAALLERARNALADDPALALSISREHERRFSRGVLGQEREVIAIEALKRLGRTGAAARRAADFERRYRGSVHRQRLEGAGGVPR